jgi:predicted Zn-dependent protease
MSLLMKALEKAAKDRGGDTRNEPVAAARTVSAAAAPAGSGLALEPIAVEVSTAPRQEAAPSPVPAGAAAAPARPARAAAPARNPAQVLASEVLQAQSASRPAPAGGAGAYVRAHPIMVFGTLAGLTALGFGIYVYLQIFQPGLFAARPPAPKGLVPLSQAPVPPSVPGTVPPSAAPLPAAPLLKEAAEESAASAARAKPQAAAAPLAAAPEDRRNVISVSRGSPEPVLNPLHTQAYGALQAGQIDEARRLYGQLANAEPKNVDALLGLAAIAAQQGNVEEASRRYLQILELEPRHALAQSGLIALLGGADPLAAESRLRQLIAREPSAFLYFTLGNLYADQSQWAAAQQAYFQAHHLEPANPDYAYNLAVALEHVSQPKLALGFYRRAVQLAATRGRANFNLAQAQERVASLARQVE